MTSLTVQNIAIMYFKQSGVGGKSAVSEKYYFEQMCNYMCILNNSCKVEPCFHERIFMQNVQDIFRVYRALTVNVF